MISSEERRRFRTDGYLVGRGLVPPHTVDEINAEIDRLEARDPPPADSVGIHFWFRPPHQLPVADRALRTTGLLEFAHQLTAPRRLSHAYGHIQVAITVPPWRHTPGGPHLDGYHDPARPHPFTMLIGIALTPQRRPNAGNLWVWPGSHLTLAAMFRERGPLVLLETGGHPTELEVPVELGEPIPLLLDVGDVVFAHYLLGHNSGGNEDGRTRRSVYYRLVAGADDDWHDRLTDPRHDYPSLA